MQGAADSTEATARGGQVLRRHVAALAARRRATGAAEDPPQSSPGRPVPRPPERIISGALGRAAERVHGLPLFFDLGVVGVLSGGSPTGVKICLDAFTGARVLQYIVYLN